MRLGLAAVIGSLLATAAWSSEREFSFDINNPDMSQALREYARVSGQQIIFTEEVVSGVVAAPLTGSYTAVAALNRLLSGTDLVPGRSPSGAVMIRSSSSAPSAQAAVVLAQTDAVVPAASASRGMAATQSTDTPDIESVVVTGSRIATRSGYEAPTPLTVLGQAELFGQTANSSVRESLAALPVFSGGYSIAGGGGSPSFNQAGISSVEMRALGLTRTLVLLDGQRSVGSIASGVVDTDNFPQQLIERVEVVTGGASAVYGSDAVAGVVNFILDHDYTGFKAELSGGVSDYGDAENYKLAMTGGFPFAGGRGHVLLSGELADNNGVLHPTNRAWNRTTKNYFINPAYAPGNGQPEFLLRDNVFLSQATHGGLITSGPLRGIAFGEGGVPYQFNYGEGVTRDLYMSGGDYLSTRWYDRAAMLPSQKRENLFGRISYDVTDRVNVYFQASRGVSSVYSIAFPHYQVGAGPQVLSGNPFIPASVQEAMTAAGVASFRLGTMNYDMPAVATDVTRAYERYVVGADGSFDVGATNWTWSSYAQIGKSDSDFYTRNARINANYTRALDAVRNPVTGTIVCRSTLTNPNNGCVPWNPMGTGVNDQAARNYILGDAYSAQTTRQEVYAGTITGQPFSNWAGPVSLALSAEYRKEEATVTPNEIARQNGYHSGNHQPLNAGFDVREAAIETLFPLLSRKLLVDNLDLSAAFRWTEYEVSGEVETWKLGLAYAMTPSLKFRATVSRDIRAPNIGELFQAQNFGLTTSFDPLTNTSPTYGRMQIGNPNLTPEIADNFTTGVVLQPGFAPGLSVSVDYWRTDIKDAIQLITGEQVIRLCYQGWDSLCPWISRNQEGAISSVQQGFFNMASQKASGVDIEASYSFPLSSLVESWQGNLTTRVMASHYFENVIDDGITFPNDSIGTIAGTPEDNINLTFSYSLDRFSASLTTRYFSDLTMDNDFIVCQSNCPTSTLFATTLDQEGVDGGLYFDMSVSYKLRSLVGRDLNEGRVYLSIRNLFNEDPEVTPTLGTSLSYSQTRSKGPNWDTLGRVYRMGIEFSF